MYCNDMHNKGPNRNVSMGKKTAQSFQVETGEGEKEDRFVSSHVMTQCLCPIISPARTCQVTGLHLSNLKGKQNWPNPAHLPYLLYSLRSKVQCLGHGPLRRVRGSQTCLCFYQFPFVLTEEKQDSV